MSFSEFCFFSNVFAHNFISGHFLNPCKKSWTQHKILLLYLIMKFAKHFFVTSTLFKYYMFEKWNIFKHFPKSTRLFFSLKYLSINQLPF
jgi:hypothetical protein